MNPAFTPNPKSNDSQKAHKDSSPLAGVQNDKLSYPQGKPTHNKHLQRKPTHNKHLQRKLACHSEGRQSLTEESLQESLTTPLLCRLLRAGVRATEESLSYTKDSLKKSPYCHLFAFLRKQRVGN
ncbi:hypothetical protein [Helicobacter marmotae]|nr:hypothetical protein [Helicobacter marmotae]